MNEPLQLKTLNLSEEGQKYFIVKLINKSALKVINEFWTHSKQ